MSRSVRHTLSCFLGKHHCEKLADRDGCHEYVCTPCGHPLLFDAEHDPSGASTTFKKKDRHSAICVISGHFIQFLTRRGGALKPSGPQNLEPSYNPAHEAGHLGHVHRPEVREPVSAVFGAAHRI